MSTFVDRVQRRIFLSLLGDSVPCKVLSALFVQNVSFVGLQMAELEPKQTPFSGEKKKILFFVLKNLYRLEI